MFVAVFHPRTLLWVSGLTASTPVQIGESQILVPVKWQHLVFASMAVKANIAHDWFIHWRHLICFDTVFAQKLEYRSGGHRRQKLPLRITPSILISRAQIGLL
jgi:hypothetical protein